MNETIQYEWTPSRARSFTRVCNMGTLSARPVFGIVGGLAIILISLYLGPVMAILGILMFAASLLQAIFQRRTIRDIGRLMTDPQMTVTITDDSIAIASADFHRTYRWERLSRHRMVQKFLFIYAGSILVAALPADLFTLEQIAFMWRPVCAFDT